MRDFNVVEELQIVQKLKDGDFKTWEYYITFLENKIKSNVNNQDAEEAIGAAILYAMNKYDGKSPFEAYVVMVFHSRTLDKAKRTKRQEAKDSLIREISTGRRILHGEHDEN